MSTTTPGSPLDAIDPALRAGVDAQYDLLAPMAPSGLDLDAARGRVEAIAARRKKARRLVAAGCAALVAVAVFGVLGALGGENPSDVVADGDRSTERTTTTVAAETTTTAIAPTETSFLPTAETLPIDTTTTVVVAVEPTPAPPSSVPDTVPVVPGPNQPLTAQLSIVTPTVQAGDVAEIDLSWRDADLAGGAPVVSVDWADPAVSVLRPGGTGGTCDSPGTPAGGTDRLRFRYATPGTHQVQVVLSTCDGIGPYAERVQVSATIVVTGPTAGAERVLVASSARLGAPVTPPLDEATAELVAGDGTITVLTTRRPVLAQFTAGGPATVLRLPADANGTLRLTWVGSTCSATAPVDLATIPTERVASVELAVSC